VVELSELKPHPNADRLVITEVNGWQLVTGKDNNFQPGQRVVHFPPDVVLPPALVKALGMEKVLSNGRVRVVKLRDEPSYGFLASLEDVFKGSEAGERHPEDLPKFLEVNAGQNLANFLGVTKYEPPVRPSSGDIAPDNALFPKYTDIQNLRHFPKVILDGEQVVVTEKIHGTNSRTGVIEGEFMAGSMEHPRLRPKENLASNLYWFPYTLDNVRSLLTTLAVSHKQVVLFGEVYGKVQDLHYDAPNQLAFRAFDLFVDGSYLNYADYISVMYQYSIPTAPVLYVGEYSLEKVLEVVDKPSVVSAGAGVEQISEGGVVRPTQERRDPKIGRVIFKAHSTQWMEKKGLKGFRDFKDE
jgi:RNA ligase (TIGR02306 family)